MELVGFFALTCAYLHFHTLHTERTMYIMEKRTLTPNEVSELFFNGEVSYWTVLKLAKSGQLPCFKVGSRYFFNWHSLENWRIAQEQQTARQIGA